MIEKIKPAKEFKNDRQRYDHFEELFDVEIDKYGIIRSPGMFEAEPYYAPYFYELMLLGDGDLTDVANGTVICKFDISESDMALIPELSYGCELVELYESDSGFVSIEIS